MPVKVKKTKGKFRVVESSTNRVVRNASGTPVDGGGHKTLEAAMAQAKAINAKKKRKVR